jgi:MoaA/NifB/PqqE/SkfB family radical SAM enzyme
MGNTIGLVRALLSNMQLIRVKPSINWFLTKYMGKFKLVNVDGRLVIHSHLPPINNKAFTRFIDQHLLGKTGGPSHAQIGLTNACPQSCRYCYNKNRTGTLLDTALIKRTIQELKSMGVFWLGFTGGEPLLNKDIVEIVQSAGDDCALKLFTTGESLTEELAKALEKAGLAYVSVSLDHWEEEIHDNIRGRPGAFRTARAAIDIFKRTGIHVSVSSVVSRQMIRENQVETFLEFLIGLGIHEAWLSETKPSSADFWDREAVITEEERKRLSSTQDAYNKKRGITVNFLGHFEGKEHFGCNAGNKMIYVDAFGEVSPCVFTPMTFGNIREKPLREIFAEMKRRFPSENRCFINNNFQLLKKYQKGNSLIQKEELASMMDEVRFGPPAEFPRLLHE